MIYPVEEEVLDELVWWVKNNVDNSQVIHTLCDLRDGSEDESTKKYFQDTIDELAEDKKYCPECGVELKPIVVRERHSHLDDNPCELIINGYECEECGNKYDY